MTPIISPWIFYVMDVCHSLKCVSLVAVIALTLIIIFDFSLFFDVNPNIFTGIKKMLIVLVVCTTVTILVPDKNTIAYMVVAENVTFERVEQMGVKTDQMIDYIIEKVDKLEKAKEGSR